MVCGLNSLLVLACWVFLGSSSTCLEWLVECIDDDRRHRW